MPFEGGYHPLLDTFGIELEFAKVQMATLGAYKGRWRVERDGSCTLPGFVFDGVPVKPDLAMQPFMRQTNIGGEIISPLLRLDQWGTVEGDLKRLIGALNVYGEDITDLTSVHIHINVGQPPLYVLRNMYKLCASIEAIMYRLAHAELGYHRGQTHGDYMYCRPITGDGPQVVRDSFGGWRWAFQRDTLLAATNSEEFFQAWCRCDYAPNNKWWPFRYYWLNPGAIVRQGSVEFRIFNQTLHVEYIKAWVDLCRAIVKRSFESSPCEEWEEQPLGSQPEFYLEHLIERIGEHNFHHKDTFHHLEGLWVKSWGWSPPCHVQVNHLCRNQGREVPLGELPSLIRPGRVTDEFVRSIWDNGAVERH